MRTRTPLLLAALLGAAALLSGCASSFPKYAEKHQAYDERASFALNLVRQHYRTQLKDAPAQDIDNNSTLISDVTLSTLAHLSGPRTYGGSFGLDIGMALLGELGRQKPVDLLPHLWGFVDATRFPNRWDAEYELARSVIAGVAEEAKKKGYVIEMWDEKPLVWKSWVVDVTVWGFTILDEEWGCVNGEDGPACKVSVSIIHQDESDFPAVPTPAWIDPSERAAWRFPYKSEFEIEIETDEAKKHFNANDMLREFAPGLPDLTYVYAPPVKVDGKNWTLPVIVSNKEAHFFIAPKGTEADGAK